MAMPCILARSVSVVCRCGTHAGTDLSLPPVNIVVTACGRRRPDVDGPCASARKLNENVGPAGTRRETRTKVAPAPVTGRHPRSREPVLTVTLCGGPSAGTFVINPAIYPRAN